ncbi:hypothetical protein GALL_325520 [mine drainage metagenome]|uniref:Protein containing DUF1810 n=1 Tax=mine drainage metagenome TaxID=410659 RepID=A0A1J5R0K7_9ZZZZ
MVEEDSDPFELARFVEAQAPCIDAALGELRAGWKRTHWMWFVVPQVQGLGFSSMAQRYAIKSRAEAKAYLNHPMLGPRLRECAEALLSVQGRSAHQIMGSPDDLKLQSSMTLFAQVEGSGSVFESVLATYFGGHRCEPTLRFLRRLD